MIDGVKMQKWNRNVKVKKIKQKKWEDNISYQINYTRFILLYILLHHTSSSWQVVVTSLTSPLLFLNCSVVWLLSCCGNEAAATVNAAAFTISFTPPTPGQKAAFCQDSVNLLTVHSFSSELLANSMMFYNFNENLHAFYLDFHYNHHCFVVLVFCFVYFK